MADTPYRAPALDKGLDILEYLAEVHEAHSMSDIARALGRSRNEIYRMTLALERRGYVERAEGTERFRLSHGLFELAMKSAPAANLHEAALPVMNRLADELLQSTHLAVLSGDEIVVVARVESPGDLGFAVRVGHRRALIQSASGLVFFGASDEVEQGRIRSVLSETDAKPAALASFEKEAVKVGKAGFVLKPSPIIEGITDIGAPVYGAHAERPAACLMMPFVLSRRQALKPEQALKSVRAAAEEISRSLRAR